ncbi:MAG TPA: CBS domain-containing protein [Blastocatellia bacterium]|nr:CBS domain-containing protein [Blastocatellia bacterium]
MKVEDVMTETVICCGPDSNLAEAVALMWKSDCGALPIVGDGGKVIGIVTDRDIAVAAGTSNRRPSEIIVSEVMSKSVYDCSPEDDIHTALKTMRKDRVRRLPVIDRDGALRGIVSMNDIVLHAEKFEGRKTIDLSYDDAVNTLKAICEHQHPKAAEQRAVAV